MKNCYVTYMSNDRDLSAVLFNNYNLKINLNSKYDFVCICTEGVSENAIQTLQLSNIKIKNVNLSKIFFDLNMDKDLIYFLLKKNYFGKFQIFDLQEYDKCVFMDSDILTIKNMDYIFENDIQDNTICMVPKLNDNLTTGRELELNYNVYIYRNSYNSGFIYFKPSKDIYQKIMDCISKIPKDDFILNIFGDECIFNYMFHNKILNVFQCSLNFNVYPMYIEDLVKNNAIKEDEIINVHFILQPKPWDIICNNNLLTPNKIFKKTSSFKWYQLWINLYSKFKINHFNNFNKILQKNENLNKNYSPKVVEATLDTEYLKDFTKKQIDAKMFFTTNINK